MHDNLNAQVSVGVSAFVAASLKSDIQLARPGSFFLPLHFISFWSCEMWLAQQLDVKTVKRKKFAPSRRHQVLTWTLLDRYLSISSEPTFSTVRLMRCFAWWIRMATEVLSEFRWNMAFFLNAAEIWHSTSKHASGSYVCCCTAFRNLLYSCVRLIHHSTIQRSKPRLRCFISIHAKPSNGFEIKATCGDTKEMQLENFHAWVEKCFGDHSDDDFKEVSSTLCYIRSVHIAVHAQQGIYCNL